MKKWQFIFLALATLLPACPTVLAQTTTRIGVKGGFHVSNLFGDDVPAIVGDDTGPKTGFFASAMVRFNLSRTVSLQPEISYIIKGTRHDAVLIDQHGNSTDGTLRTDLAYLGLSFLLQRHYAIRQVVSPVVFVGPELAFLQSAKAVFDHPELGTLEFAIDESVRDFDLGLIIGAGLDIRAGTGRVVTDLRYTFGLLSIDASEADGVVRNGTLSVSVGFLFPLHRWW